MCSSSASTCWSRWNELAIIPKMFLVVLHLALELSAYSILVSFLCHHVLRPYEAFLDSPGRMDVAVAGRSGPDPWHSEMRILGSATCICAAFS